MLISFLIFIIILFLYVHITDHFKKSEDLEIYEMDYVSNPKLQEVCSIKQPVLFDFFSVYNENISLQKNLEESKIDVKVKDTQDYPEPIILPFRSFIGLSKTDPTGHYFIEDNQDFLEETDFLSDIQDMDAYLKPPFTVNTKYDYLLGSAGCTTPLKYHTDFRKFVLVTSGRIQVKLCSWKNHRYLSPMKDYETYEFWSKTNLWKSPVDERIRVLDIDVPAGFILYIPPYWWYSIRFSSAADTQLISLQYQTGITMLSNLPELFRYYLQFNNIKHKVARTLESVSEHMEPASAAPTAPTATAASVATEDDTINPIL